MCVGFSAPMLDSGAHLDTRDEMVASATRTNTYATHGLVLWMI